MYLKNKEIIMIINELKKSLKIKIINRPKGLKIG